VARAVAAHVNAIVVDGHNALHRLRIFGPTPEQARERLLDRVRAAAPRGATVFFDGHPGAGAFGGTEWRGITLRFAGDVEADDAIVDFVRSSRRPRSLVVVTDDLELAKRAEQLGASSLRVAQFLAEVADDPQEAADAKTCPDGFRPADFGLPDAVDLDRPPQGMEPRRRPRRFPPRG
jgi:hypothetical protein